MSRKKIAAGNWKMNTTIDEGIQLASEIANSERNKDVEVILGVPFTHLYPLKKKIPSRSKIKLAAQTCHHLNSGAFTGEISPTNLVNMGIQYVILGHSERRMYNHESDELLKQKVNAALDAGLKVIFCCGEPLEVRKKAQHLSYVKAQLEASLFQVNDQNIKNIILAYEPIWAIGTGETASNEQAQEMHAAIRSFMSKRYNKRISNGISILYGGSVKSSNSKDLFSCQDVDGGLIGGASLSTKEFVAIINSFS